MNNDKIVSFHSMHSFSQPSDAELASNPGSPFRILSCSFGDFRLSVLDFVLQLWRFSPKLQDKIRNGEPGFEANAESSFCCDNTGYQCVYHRSMITKSLCYK